MLKQTVIITLTICAMGLLAIQQPAYAQISEFKIAAFDSSGRLIFEIQNLFIKTNQRGIS